MKIRKLTLEDLCKIFLIQSKCYSKNFIESIETFKRLIEIYPEGCIGAEIDDIPVGYIFTHPWIRSSVVKLNGKELNLPKEPDCMCIHDMAVDPEFRGRGIGKTLFGEALELCKRADYKMIDLVSVQKSQTFWEKLGFKKVAEILYGKERAFLMEFVV
jgi:Acetyltransferases